MNSDNYTNFSKLTLIFFIVLTGCAEKISSYTELSQNGYSVIPAPREINMTDKEINFSSDWGVTADNQGNDHLIVKTLTDELKKMYNLDLTVNGAARKNIYLHAEEGSVITNARDDINSQAYSIKIKPSEIEIKGNSKQGLFYGVQTFIQLVKPSSDGKFLLPAGTVRDWPGGQLRFLHWDTKHHQDRMETLKRYLDWSAKFKINMIGFELEDKFAYPSHPEIGAPGAFTTEELQEIVNYGLERYIQVVPVIQSPAHMAYVLKHPEFKAMRTSCDRCPPDGLNYQVCLCDERSYELIFDMYRDVLAATKGVDYFHVSTDEVYYAGICDKCEPPLRWEDLSADSRDSRSMAWVEFARRAHDFLKDNNRRMLAWVEYPLLTKYISQLPPGIIDGVYQGKAFVDAQKKIGMKGLIYVSLQGSEQLIPRNFGLEGDPFSDGRIKSTFETLSFPHMDSIAEGPTIWDSEYPPLGVFGAAWDDSGLHNETFWPGWSTVAQYGWTPGIPSVQAHISDFIKIYYGPGMDDMTEIYKELQAQTDFYERCWDRIEAPEVKLNYGNSNEIYETPRVRRRASLPQPALPDIKDLKIEPVYINEYETRVNEAMKLLKSNEDLRKRIQTKIDQAKRNKYNIEVLLSIAELTRHNNVMIVSMKEIEDYLTEAYKSSESGDHNSAVKNLTSAYNVASEVLTDLENTYKNFTATWEKSRFPKGMSVEGRDFFHELDDIKDHWADTTPDLSFYIAAEKSIKLDEWNNKLEKIISAFADRHNVEPAGF